MNNLRRTEKILFSLALAALLVFSYFMYDDSLLFPSLEKSDLPQVGKIYETSNDVRRKNYDTFAWIPANNSTLVYQQDSIFTGDSSSAQIQLNDGTLISVKPNSLITLNMNNGQLTLDLKYGDLQAQLNAQSQLTVKTGKEQTTIQGDASGEQSLVRMKKAFSGLNVNLEKGKASLITQGKKKDLELNENLKIAKSGQIDKIEKPELQILTENKKKWLKPDPLQAIPVKWDSKGSITGFEVELSKDPEFKDLLVSEKVQNQEFQFANTQDEGTYYWRVKAYDSLGVEAQTSAIQEFTVSLFKAPTLLTPGNFSSLAFEVKASPNQKPASALSITWQAMPELESFEYQVSTDPEFKSVLVSKNVDQLREAQTPPLTNGDYYIRVRGFAPKLNVTTDWSPAHEMKLNLVAKKEARPPAPLITKKQIQFIPNAQPERDIASPSTPEVAWSYPSEAKSFKVQVSKDLNFKNAETFETTSREWNWNEYSKGKSYYRVFAVSPSGVTSLPSEVGEITVGFKEPILSDLKSFELRGKNQDEEAPAQNLKIDWTPVPTAKSYRLEMSTSPEFKNPVVTELSSTTASYVIESPGSYFFRVKAFDKENQEITDYSSVKTSSYLWRAPLGTPRLKEPFNNASIFLQKETDAFIWLEWKKVQGAKSYTLEISTSPDFSKPFVKTNVGANRYLIKEKVPLGKLYWRVRADSDRDSEHSDWTASREFTIYSQKNEAFVQ